MNHREIQMVLLARKLRPGDQARQERFLMKALAWAVAINLVVILPLILFACRHSAG